MRAIVNVSMPSWGIGCSGALLAHIPADMKHFAARTSNQVVIYGRKTLETFPGKKPLKNRTNLILSTNRDLSIEGAQIVHNLSELFDVCHSLKAQEIWVIGGETVYRTLLPYCQLVDITQTFCNVQADTFFPNLDTLPQWSKTCEEDLQEYNTMPFRFAEYRNSKPKPW